VQTFVPQGMTPTHSNDATDCNCPTFLLIGIVHPQSMVVEAGSIVMIPACEIL